MTKLYDALREAGAVGLNRGEPAKASASTQTAEPSPGRPTGAAFSAMAGGASDPASDIKALREIIFGKLFEEYEQLMTRLEERLAGEASHLRSELAELDRTLAGRMEQIEARNVKAHSDLREQLLSQSNLLNDAIQERGEHVSKRLEDGLAELRETKIDRTTFSSFLGSLASHIGELRAASGADPRPERA
jgi:hypothetical protein